MLNIKLFIQKKIDWIIIKKYQMKKQKMKY